MLWRKKLHDFIVIHQMPDIKFAKSHFLQIIFNIFLLKRKF